MDFIRQAQEHITSGTVKEGSLQVLGWVGDNIQAETGIHQKDLIEINSVVDQVTGINAEHALSGALNEVGELLAPLSKAVLEKLEVLEKTSKLWSKRVKYHSGDTCKARQNQSKKMMVYQCREFPYGDFCELRPEHQLGKMAWKLFDGVTREDAREPTPCRLSGEFAVGDLLCEGNHVWKCKADSTKRLHCNNTLPLESSGYIVWSLERGTPDPIQINRESEEFVEPSKIELMQLLRSKKLPPGHQNRFEPFILPISLQEYKKLFFDNDAPNFLTTFLTENGAQLFWLEDWFDWSTIEGFKDPEVYDNYHTIQNQQVERVRRYHVNHIITPNPFAKAVLFEGLLCEVENEPTSIKSVMRVFGPQTFVWDRMNVWEQYEIMTTDPRSSQVVVRQSYRYEWINPPWHWYLIQKCLDFELSGMSKIPEWQSKKVEEYLKLARPPQTQQQNQATLQLITAEQDIENNNTSPISQTLFQSFLLVFFLLSVAFQLLKCFRKKRSQQLPTHINFEAVPRNSVVVKQELEPNSETDSSHSSLKSD